VELEVAAVAEPVAEETVEPAVEDVSAQLELQAMAEMEVAAAVQAEPELFVGPLALEMREPTVGPEQAAAVDTPEHDAAASFAVSEQANVVMLWEPVEAAHQPEMAVAESVDSGVAAGADLPLDDIAEEDSFDPMISSLEDALALLAAANDAREAESRRHRFHSSGRATASFARASRSPMSMRTTVFAEPDDSLATLVARALGASLDTHNNLEAVALQGTLIQKESAMTEVQEVVTATEPQGQTVPITAAELQEVAATLSVPKVEADPDDVLSDVQNTLNSLAGMAQGLTQQKQAAGRLQDELEEWNNQLLERERLASDKEARLAQLDDHLLQAKTNLDRLAAENNRLLTERSEALKQLAQSVDQRDKSTLKRAEAMQVEQQRIDEQAATLRSRASELDERESSLKRKSEELAVRLKQLQSAKDKFSAIVKSFNETVQFNTTLSAISKSVIE
jgi:DNA repair exonuclease SbcCD ATPase subunit